jgi:opacity protein-like surface antigen
MKKIILVLGAVYLSLGIKAGAQNTDQNTKPRPDFHIMELGIRLMPTLSAFDMQTSNGGTIKGEVTLGWGIGTLLAFNFTNHIGIQGEVIYNSLSQKYKDQDLDREINVRYINVPVLLSLNTGKSRPVNLNAVVGPQFGFNIGSSIKGSGGSGSDTLTAVLATKKSDFGFAYGAGLEFALNEDRNVRMDLGFRGVYGFVNISDTNQTSNDGGVFILDRANVRTYSAYLGITLLF